MEAYYLLTNNEGLALDEFLNNIKDSLKDETPELMIASTIEQRDRFKTKLSKLIDLYVDGEIDKAIYDRKQIALEKKIEEANERIEQLSKITMDDDKFEKQLEN